MTDRQSRDERALYALLSEENPDDVTLDEREDRQVVPAGYAADGVCGGRCPTDADDAPDTFVDAAVAAVREWESRNEPLGKRAVDDLRSRFAREPGEPAVCDNSHGSRCVHLREVEATELGVWVANADVALVDLDDDVRFADLHAVPIDEDGTEYVPLVVAADGFFGEVAASFHEHYHALQRVRARLDAAGPILTDGGDMSEDDSELTAIELSRAQWRTLLTRCPEQTYGDLISAVDDADMINPENPASVVDAAIANGPLIEDDAGMFPRIHLDGEPPESEDTGESAPKDADSEETNPKGETGDSDEDDPDSSTPASVASWSDVDFSIIDPRTWAPAQIAYESWMCRTDSKAPYAPWTDSNAPVECGRDHEDREGAVRCSTCDHAAGYKWGSDGSQEYVHADHDTAREWADMDPSLSSDLAFIQHDEDPFAFVDGDDVRDPETGEIHPAFRAILEHLGLTYADVSTSGSGVHAVYRGEIPLDGVSQAMFAINDKPFGANEDVPEVEIYDSKHVCIATGDHVPASGTEVNFWDEDALTTILQANGIESSPEPSADTSIDLTEHTPTATTSDETTDEIRDIFAALDRINAQRVAHDTIVATWNDSAGTSSGNRAFAPTWGPSANGTANIVNEEIWQDTGGNGYGGIDVMAAIDCPDLPSYDENTQPRDLNGADWFRALKHLRDLGYPIPELEPDATDGDGDGDPDEYRSDPTDLTATVSVKRAWDAAGRVSPSDVDSDSEFPVNDDAGSFACPCCGEPVDVVRAVAIDTGLVDSCEDSLDETYPTAYDRARSLGAPLPEYYTTTDAIARFDALLDVIGEVTFWDLDTDALDSEVTGTDDDVSGDAVRTLNPSWRESDSEASVLVFPSGTIWDADTERVLDAVRFAAVDSGLIEDPTAPVEGALFTEAYRRCRNYYDAPLPRWHPGGDRTVTPDLPDGRDLVDTRDVDGVNVDRLEDARKRVEKVVGDLVSVGEDGDNIPTVVTSPPATGKTTATVKSARDGPNAYTTPRKELQQQAVDKADRWGVDSYILPVFSEESVRSGIIEEAVAHVRANSKDCLRDRWALINAAVGAVDGKDNIDACDIFDEDDEEEESVDLDRATCPTADGDHGVAWALAVHIAHRLGYRPGEIHGRAKGLFGASLPCCEDGSCEYGNAWEDVRDPDNCPDLLVGSHTHAHLESVRTYYERDSSGGVDRSPRTVVVDEFPGEAFTNDLGPEAFDFATWLARSLRGDIDDRRDMFDADLYSDDWVRAWLEGAIGEDRDSDSDSDDPILAEVERVIHALARVGELLDARDSAADIVSEYGGALEELGVRSTLTEFVDGTTPEDEVYRALEDLTEESVDENLRNIFDWIIRDVHDPLARATDSGTEPADAGIHTAADTDLPIGGDLASLLEDAVDAAHTRGDAARERIRAAVESLRGGPDGCRQLAAWADDGYAHPDAHHILTGIITPTDDDSDVADTDADATRINTSSWAFDPSADEGSVMDVVSTAGNATTIVDRNDHGARLHTPPSRVAGNGEKAPLVGLDATGRAILWRVVLGEEVQTTDIFDSDRERRQFLEDTLDLRVIQAADDPRFYEGDPATKDTDGDAALLQAIAEEYSGIQAPRQRGEEPQEFGKPAVITTKRIREVLESDPRLDGVVDTWDNYGNVTGKNELGEHRLAAILGCQHFGDDAIEQFAALAGEEVDTDHLTGRGPDLDYDSDVANAYLQHMTDDKTMQAILRFARGEDGGATVVARTSALRDDLPVVGRGEVVETWSETATKIVRKARSLGREFTSADVRPAVDVKSRQVRRVLSELVDAGYLAREDGGPGVAHEYEQVGDPGAGEVSIPDRDEAVPDTETPGQSSSNTYYTRNVRVFDPNRPREDDLTPPPGTYTRAPPAPGTIEGVGPPG